MDLGQRWLQSALSTWERPGYLGQVEAVMGWTSGDVGARADVQVPLSPVKGEGCCGMGAAPWGGCMTPHPLTLPSLRVWAGRTLPAPPDSFQPENPTPPACCHTLPRELQAAVHQQEWRECARAHGRYFWPYF